MEASDLMARMAAKTPDMQAVGVSSVQGLTEADAAMALAGLDRGPYLLARVKFSLDDSSRYPLENQLWSEMCGVATRKRWKVPVGREFLRGLSRMAVNEAVSPCKCSRCSGRGSIYPRGAAARVCNVCLGTGRGCVSGSARAKAAGVDKSNWSRVWGKRYELFLSRLDGWERVMLAHVQMRLKVC